MLIEFSQSASRPGFFFSKRMPLRVERRCPSYNDEQGRSPFPSSLLDEVTLLICPYVPKSLKFKGKLVVGSAAVGILQEEKSLKTVGVFGI